MKCFFALLKVEFLGLFGLNKALKSNDKKEKNKLAGLLALAIIFLLLAVFISVTYSVGIGFMMKELGDDISKLPAMMFTIASIFVLISTMRTVNGVVFGFKDYELLNSFPVKPIIIFLAKITYVYILSFGIFLLLCFPSGIVYYFLSGLSDVIMPVRLVVLLPFIPLLPMSIGIVLGTIISLVTAKFKRSTLLSVVLYTVIIGAYFYFVTSMTGNAEEMVNIINVIFKIYPVNYLFTASLCYGNVWYFLAFTIGSLLIFLLVAFLLGKFFKKINSVILYKTTSITKKVKIEKQKSSLKALLNKEMKRYFSSSLLIFNASGGTLLSIIMCVILIINGVNLDFTQINEEFGFDIQGLISGMVPVLSVFFVGGCAYSSMSISLEGKNLWILKSSPINVKDVYNAKLIMNLFIALPSAIITVATFSFVFKLNAIYILFAAGIAIAYSFLSSEFGLLMNIKFPVFDWESEAAVVKRGTAVMLQTLVGMFAIFPIMIIQGVFLLLNAYIGLGLIFILMVVADIVLYNVINTWGIKKFATF